MAHVLLTIPGFAFIVATRAALGVGVGLLVSNRIPEDRRRRVGTALVAVGAATTVPAVMQVIRGRRRFSTARRAGAGRDPRLIGATRFPRKGDDDY
jgi:hypothetical protein